MFLAHSITFKIIFYYNVGTLYENFFSMTNVPCCYQDDEAQLVIENFFRIRFYSSQENNPEIYLSSIYVLLFFIRNKFIVFCWEWRFIYWLCKIDYIAYKIFLKPEKYNVATMKKYSLFSVFYNKTRLHALKIQRICYNNIVFFKVIFFRKCFRIVFIVFKAFRLYLKRQFRCKFAFFFISFI